MRRRDKLTGRFLRVEAQRFEGPVHSRCRCRRLREPVPPADRTGRHDRPRGPSLCNTKRMTAGATYTVRSLSRLVNPSIPIIAVSRARHAPLRPQAAVPCMARLIRAQTKLFQPPITQPSAQPQNSGRSKRPVPTRLAPAPFMHRSWIAESRNSFVTPPPPETSTLAAIEG
ncbi:hypothetical protein BU26DRAFT_56064 [Trematosphaeria pertusa]|uniref:Uncharacterized protein n=1 Tax=Trematosphaeria pertusa TaxID=390896 RepID=A0A6A6I8R6_9PLEO|nr:uncharacterized protein BU26DRAFT_56064 [Trematosphaeria pertusa]KAF2246954.1 hypothetical protein BU26DRAFT_56064 [Trematosphaeria pertusa]